MDKMVSSTSSVFLISLSTTACCRFHQILRCDWYAPSNDIAYFLRRVSSPRKAKQVKYPHTNCWRLAGRRRGRLSTADANATLPRQVSALNQHMPSCCNAGLTRISAADIGHGKLASELVVTGMTKLSILNLRYRMYWTVTSELEADPHLP
jgi:hypothetical protein